MHKYTTHGLLIALALTIYLITTLRKEIPIFPDSLIPEITILELTPMRHSHADDPLIPGMTVVELPPLRYVYADHYNIVTIDINDDLWMWGYNIDFPILEGEEYLHTYFLNPVWKASDVQTAKTYSSSCFILKNDGTLWTSGGFYGILGQGSQFTSSSEPRMILEGVCQFDIGDYGGVAVKTDNTLWAWGYLGTYNE